MPENDVVFITCLMSYEDGMWYSCTMYDFIMDIIHFVQSKHVLRLKICLFLWLQYII